MNRTFTMTSDGPMLEGASPSYLAELLVEYEALVAEHIPNVRHWLNPGLSATEVSTILRGHGLTPTPELAVIYGWANGTDFSTGPGYPLPNFPFIALEDTFPRYDMERPPEGFSWGADDGWLRIVADNYGCAVELTEAPVSRIHYATADFEDEPDRYRAVSLCTFVAWRIEGLEAGAYRWDPATYGWEITWGLVPELQMRTGWG